MEIDVAEIPPLAGFTGKELDAETGLYHLGARSYDPWSGLFMETDPLADLSSGDSPYMYSNDSPIAYSDPTGAYSYAIDGMSVSSQVGQSFYSMMEGPTYQIDQQVQQTEDWNNWLNSAGDFALTDEPITNTPVLAPDEPTPASQALGKSSVSGIPDAYDWALRWADYLTKMGIGYLWGSKNWRNGIDCSYFVCLANGLDEHSWATAKGSPPGLYSLVSLNETSIATFLASAKKGDLFVWPGNHPAFYTGHSYYLLEAHPEGIGIHRMLYYDLSHFKYPRYVYRPEW